MLNDDDEEKNVYAWDHIQLTLFFSFIRYIYFTNEFGESLLMAEMYLKCLFFCYVANLKGYLSSPWNGLRLQPSQ